MLMFKKMLGKFMYRCFGLILVVLVVPAGFAQYHQPYRGSYRGQRPAAVPSPPSRISQAVGEPTVAPIVDPATGRTVSQRVVGTDSDGSVILAPVDSIAFPPGFRGEPTIGSVVGRVSEQLSHPAAQGQSIVPPQRPVTEVPTLSPQALVEKSADAQQEERVIDANLAKLARIQLEKKQIDLTLAIVGKMSTKAIQAKTLTELAEYVAHDPNYSKEARRLFHEATRATLLLGGMKLEDLPELQQVEKQETPLIPVPVSRPVPASEPISVAPPKSVVPPSAPKIEPKAPETPEAIEDLLPSVRPASKPAPPSVSKPVPPPLSDEIEDLIPETPKRTSTVPPVLEDEILEEEKKAPSASPAGPGAGLNNAAPDPTAGNSGSKPISRPMPRGVSKPTSRPMPRGAASPSTVDPAPATPATVHEPTSLEDEIESLPVKQPAATAAPPKRPSATGTTPPVPPPARPLSFKKSSDSSASPKDE